MHSSYTREICEIAPVIPVITVERLEDAKPLAEALVAGGLPVLEVTLRTPVALDAIKAMQDVAGGIVGAGTVLSATDADKALAAGARSAVSPGSTGEVLQASIDKKLPLLPGTATSTDVMKVETLAREAAALPRG